MLKELTYFEENPVSVQSGGALHDDNEKNLCHIADAHANHVAGLGLNLHSFHKKKKLLFLLRELESVKRRIRVLFGIVHTSRDL